jgi:hypothetical protein
LTPHKKRRADARAHTTQDTQNHAFIHFDRLDIEACVLWVFWGQKGGILSA